MKKYLKLIPIFLFATLTLASTNRILDGTSITVGPGGGTLTLPNVTDTLVGKNTTDIFTNKSMSGASNTFTLIPNSATTATAAASASAIVTRDANANAVINNLLENYVTTATAGGTTVLTVSSAFQQFFTGTLTQSVQLPDATTLALGQQFQILNRSSGVVTVKNAGSSTVQAIAANAQTTVTVTNIGSSNGSWDSNYSTTSAGTVTSVGMSVPSFLSINGTPVTTSGTLAVTLSGTALPIANGGTSATSKAAAFDALSPMTTLGDGIFGGASGTNTRVVGNTTAAINFLAQTGTGAASVLPVWTSFNPPTTQVFTVTGTTTGYLFTVTSANATVGATYTNNGNTYTVLGTIASGTRLFTSQASAPAGSGTLTKSGGTGDATISFSAAGALATYTTPTGPRTPLYLQVQAVGAGGGGAAGGATGTQGNDGNDSLFGVTIVQAGGGKGGAGSAGVGGVGGISTLTTSSTVLKVAAVSGSPGGGGVSIINSSGGNGGGTYYGGEGGGGVTLGVGSNGSANTGGGGGGGGANAVAQGSGAGGGGGGYIETIITSPNSTYVYQVGLGGAGGSTTNTGGNGGTGYLVVTEHYQ